MHYVGDSTFDPSIVIATYDAGAKLNWHIHPGGQVLRITERTGPFPVARSLEWCIQAMRSLRSPSWEQQSISAVLSGMSPTLTFRKKVSGRGCLFGKDVGRSCIPMFKMEPPSSNRKLGAGSFCALCEFPRWIALGGHHGEYVKAVRQAQTDLRQSAKERDRSNVRALKL